MGVENPHGVTSVAPLSASVTVTLVSVTLPVFFTVTVQTTGSPALTGAPDLTVLVTSTAAAGVIVTLLVPVPVTLAPTGGLPVAFAVLVTDPASTSPWVTEYDTSQATEA